MTEDARPIPVAVAQEARLRTKASAVGLRTEARTFLLDCLHLVVLGSFAVAQPLFEVLAEGASFFAVRGSSGTQIVGFALIVTLVPPLFLAAAELLVRIVLGTVARRVLHVVFVALLGGLLSIQALEHVGVSSENVVLVLSAGTALAGAVLYVTWRPVRSVLTALAPAPLLFLGLFLLHSPVSKLVLPGEAHAATAGIGGGAPVVIVVFDEFSVESLMGRDLRINRSRFPNFAALAGSSSWFRNAATVALGTDGALPAILTGKYPKHGSLPVFRDHPNSVFTLLGGTYRMNVHETETRLCPRRICPQTAETGIGTGLNSLLSDVSIVYGHIVLPDELAQRLPSISTTWGNFRGQDLELRGRAITQRSAFDRFLTSIQPTPRSSLHFLHVELPHVPWRYLPSGRQYEVPALYVPGLDRLDVWEHDPWLVRQSEQRYLLQVGFVDRLLGRLIRHLREASLFDRALVVVTADHGVSFHTGESRRASVREVQDLAFVPLFVKLPRQRKGLVVDRVVRSIDVVPTIADALGVRIPWHVDGRSALHNLDVRRITVERMRFSSATVVERKNRAVRLQARLFGDTAWRAVFAAGPNGTLIGRKTRGLRRGHVGRVRGSFSDEDRLRIVDPAGRVVPALISGNLEGPDADAGIDVAIALNGRVAGVGRSYRRAGTVLFSALVPESAFHRGPNEALLFAVARRGKHVVVQSLSHVGGADTTTYALRRKAIRSSRGRTFRILPGAVAGYVDSVDVQDGQAHFVGWAGDVPHRRVRSVVLVFTGTRFVYAYRTISPGGRPDLPRGLADAGFEFTLPVRLLGRRPKIHVFGVVGHVASELLPARRYPWDGPAG